MSHSSTINLLPLSTTDPFYDHFAYSAYSSTPKNKSRGFSHHSEREYIFTREDAIYDHFCLRSYSSTSSTTVVVPEKKLKKYEEADNITFVTDLTAKASLKEIKVTEPTPLNEESTSITYVTDLTSSTSSPLSSSKPTANVKALAPSPSTPPAVTAPSRPPFPPPTASRFEIQDWLHALLISHQTPSLPPFSLYHLAYSGRDLHAMAHDTSYQTANLTLEFVTEILRCGMSPKQAELVHGEIVAQGGNTQVRAGTRDSGYFGEEWKAWEAYHRRRQSGNAQRGNSRRAASRKPLKTLLVVAGEGEVSPRERVRNLVKELVCLRLSLRGEGQ